MSKRPHSSHKQGNAHSGHRKHVKTESGSRGSSQRHGSSSKHISQRFIPSVDTADSKAQKKKRSEFVHPPLVYRSSLPDPPFYPKLLKVELPQGRLVNYCGYSLEKATPYEFLTETDMGVPIDLVDRELYGPWPPVDSQQKSKILPEDEALFSGQIDLSGTKRVDHQFRIKVNRMANDMSTTMSFIAPRKFVMEDEGEHTKFVYETDVTRQKVEEMKRKRELEKKEKEDIVSQEIKAIEQTFHMARRPPRHPTNKDLVPLEIYDLVPWGAGLDPTGKELVGLDSEGVDPDLLSSFVEFIFPPNPPLQEGAVLKSFSQNLHDIYRPTDTAGLANVKEGDEKDMTWSAEYLLQPTPNIYDNEFHVVRMLDDTSAGPDEKAPAGPKRGRIFYAKYQRRMKLRTRVATQIDNALDVADRPKMLKLNYTHKDVHGMAVAAQAEKAAAAAAAKATHTRSEGEGDESEEGEGEGEESTKESTKGGEENAAALEAVEGALLSEDEEEEEEEKEGKEGKEEANETQEGEQAGGAAGGSGAAAEPAADEKQAAGGTTGAAEEAEEKQPAAAGEEGQEEQEEEAAMEETAAVTQPPELPLADG
eukprot:g40647.t1